MKAASTGKALIAGGASGTAAITSSRQKDMIRIGIAQAYVSIVRELGSDWLERNLHYWIGHVLELVAKFGPLAYSNGEGQASEVLLMRRCALHVLRQTLGPMISESYQISACKQLGEALSEYISCFGEWIVEWVGERIFNLKNISDCVADQPPPTSSSDTSTHPDPSAERLVTVEMHSSAQASVVALLEISGLVRQVGTSIEPIFTEASGILEPIFASLLHPIRAARVSAAWCLRCVTQAVPSQLTPLVDRCLNRLEHMRRSSEALSGYSLALSALLAGARNSELGVPHSKCRQVFTAGEELIKTATLSPQLAREKTNAGWLLISAAVAMGPAYMRPSVERLAHLWRCSFPRSGDEAGAEKERGDAFTWESTLEARSGALGSMHCLVRYCPELVDEELERRILLPVETTLVTMALVADLLVLQHGSRLRTPLYTLRLRLYSLVTAVLPLLGARRVESLVPLNSLLRELVADITMTDNVQAVCCSSQLSALCTTLEQTLLGGWLRNTPEAYLELEAHPHQTVIGGATENDPVAALIMVDGVMGEDGMGLGEGYNWPEPLPPNIASLDAAVSLFGRLFPSVNGKRRLQLIQHFLSCVGAKSATGKQATLRQMAVQLNILGAMCAAMRAMGETRGALDFPNLKAD